MDDAALSAERYYFQDDSVAIDVISKKRPIKLKYHAGGKWIESKSTNYIPCYDPSTGAIIAYAPLCTAEDVESTIRAAATAYPEWSNTPVSSRVQVLFRMKALIDKHLDELTHLCAMEEGKKWEEARGDILKVNEVVEYACGAPHIMKGEALMDTSRGYDTTRYSHPVGVFAGITPWNFPAMIPQGWLAPICIATGNVMVLKPANFVPQSSMRMLELWLEAGLPAGVLNIITADPPEAEMFCHHPDIKGVSFVGSTDVGVRIYAAAAANGKRVQVLTSAKNHALVLRDCNVGPTAQGIINAFCGCAGERCMALPVIVVENAIADRLIAAIKGLVSRMKLGVAFDKTTDMGPLVSESHREFVLRWIATGIEEGAELIVDGRNPQVPSICQKGFFVGPTIFDHVTEDMSVGREEIFGPVLCIKRVDSFEEGLNIVNASRFANGAVIYTRSGYYARTFAQRADAGMVGVNAGIPVPISIFGFTGHKRSFFGDLHVMGRDGFIFFTESKNVTSTWFREDATEEVSGVDTWDGTVSR
jgi:malonate-semialdehyde dehydrogenase (acetylating)/methylmalonate-semialdehyde dehydrogenase